MGIQSKSAMSSALSEIWSKGLRLLISIGSGFLRICVWCYTVLGLNKDVNKAHNKKAQEEDHPDRNPYKDEVEVNMAKIEEANSVFSPKRRRLSDEGLYYYTVLGLNKDASSTDVKKAYHKKALKYHPDRNPDKNEAEVKMAKIAQANSVLSDAEKRKVYDKWGSKGIHAGKNLESMDRVNGLTMFVLKCAGGFPEHTNE